MPFRLKKSDRGRKIYSGNTVYRLYVAIKKCMSYLCACLCPWPAKILKSKRNEYKILKAVLGFSIGVTYGYALNTVVLNQLQLNEFNSKVLGLTVCLFLGCGFSLSTQFRCISFLVIPTMSGRTGRAYVSAYMFTQVLSGPANNIMSNGQESLRVLSCVITVTLNHTVERFKLMFKPMKGIIKEFATAAEKAQKDAKQLDGAYNVIETEVKDEEEVKKAISDTEQLDKELGSKSRAEIVRKKFSKYNKKVFGGETEAKYGIKAEFRCEEVFTKGVRGCRTSFGKAYDRCLSAVPIIGYLLCWPMKLTFICDIAAAFMGKRTCDSKQALSPGFGESMETAGNVMKEFHKQFEVKMQYKLIIPEEKADLIMPEDVGKALEKRFDAKKKKFESLMRILSRMLAFMFLLVFYLSTRYCDRYLRNIQFDNIYVTSYFRHIDNRRRNQGKMTLLPLKKGERLELQDPFGVKLSREEKTALVLNFLRLIGEMTTVTIVILFDRVFYEFLMLVQRHAYIEYRQTGAHHVSMTIYGDGFIGQLVRKILKGFNQKHSLDSVTNTAACLPMPSKIDVHTIVNIYLIFVASVALMMFEAYGMRLRRVVCSFFYHKREKQRVLFLYNDRLKKRKSYLHHMRKKVIKMARENSIAVDTAVFGYLYSRYPKYFKWLKTLGLTKRKCLVCEEVEKRKDEYVKHSPECSFVYCVGCWKEIGEKCHVCEVDQTNESDVSDDDDDDLSS